MEQFYIDTFELIKHILPNESKELFLSFDSFVKHFKAIIDQLKLISQEKLDNNQFDDEYLSLSSNLSKLYTLYKTLQNINTSFLPEDVQNSTDYELNSEEQNFDKESIIDDNIDITKYTSIHYLDECFNTKTPVGFSFQNNELILTPTWTSFYKKVCCLLFNIDKENFYELINILNDKRILLSQNKYQLYMPLELTNDLYLEANLPTSEFIDILRRIFSIYNISIHQLKIYLKNEQTFEDVVKSEINDSETTQISNRSYIDSVKINYADYQVNKTKVHYLDENFVHKKVCGYVLAGFNYSSVDSWASLYVEICNKLISLDSTKFINIQDWFKGSKPYLSYDKTVLRKARKLSNNIYLETNQSAHQITSNIAKLLKYYGFQINHLKIYLRADYTALHNH